MKNSIRLVERKTLGNNQVFNLFFDHIQDQQGFEVENYFVLSPKKRNAENFTGVCILPILQAPGQPDRFCFIKIFRHPIGKELIELPRGFIDSNESPLEAGQRELQEETGLPCTSAEMVDLGWIYPEPGIIDGRIALFACLVSKNHTDKLSPFSGSEMGISSLVDFSFSETLDAIESGKIVDSTSIVAVLKYLKFKAVLPN